MYRSIFYTCISFVLHMRMYWIVFYKRIIFNLYLQLYFIIHHTVCFSIFIWKYNKSEIVYILGQLSKFSVQALVPQ